MDLKSDPVLERIAGTVREGLSVAEPGRDGTSALAALADMDGFAFAAAIDLGGFDLGLSCGVTIAVELGRRALPDVYSGGMLVVDALAEAGEDAPGADVAAAVVAGKQVVVAAGLDQVCRPTAVRARRSEGGWRPSGAVTVEDVHPDQACCAAFRAEEGDGEVLLAVLPSTVWRGAAGPAYPWSGPVESPAALSLDEVTVTSGQVVGGLGAGRPLSDPAGLLARHRVRQAGYLLGFGFGAHALAVTHTANRRQFDRFVLDNQAVAFPLAKARIDLEAARLLVYRAAWQADAGEPFSREAAEALAWTAEVALRTIRISVQAHGARGLTLGAPVHRFFEVIRSAATRLGPPGALWQEAGRHRLAAIHPAAASSDAAAPSDERQS
ncbi:acyl-CoA dehydrogenase family protein [Sphaerisporangium sp. NPDC051011]|uniref:acyl-CoA dehydrogenase family protein n=1 Tax=Sphaerisporangium sp. NPDC051011 TaxID=3155792 RepID=UPI0033F30DEB